VTLWQCFNVGGGLGGMKVIKDCLSSSMSLGCLLFHQMNSPLVMLVMLTDHEKITHLLLIHGITCHIYQSNLCNARHACINILHYTSMIDQ
jgi:hypothetical protein